MDLEGFENIYRAVVFEGIDITITPKPNVEQDARFVTIETTSAVQPARVLNALQKANLIYREGPKGNVLTDKPELRPISLQPGSMTFEDMNCSPNR